MSDDRPYNIFDPDFSRPLKPKPKRPVEPPSAPSKPPPPKETPAGKKKHYDPETDQLLEKIFRMREDLEQKLNTIYEKTGLPRAEIERFLSDRKNFPGDRWERIEKEKKDLEQRLYHVLKMEKREVSKKEAEFKAEKDRKGKFLGGRKKWIPIR